MSKDLKIFLKAILIMTIGGFVGFFMAKFDMPNLMLKFENIVISKSLIIYYVIILIGIFIDIILYFLGKKRLIVSLNTEDLDEKYLSLGLTIIGTLSVISIGLFLINIYNIENLSFTSSKILVIFQVIFTIVLAMLNHFYIKFIKSYNKGKLGEVTDFTFVSKWVNSCDEREQLEIYKAGFKTYILIQTILIISLLVIGFYTFITKRGVFSILIVMFTLIVGNIYYYLLTKGK